STKLWFRVQKQQQIEADYSKQLQELRSELASRDELQMKLESRVKYLENENELLEEKEKDLKETINGLLLSWDAFVCHYEVLDGVHHLVNEKEKVVTELKNKVQRISTLENVFVVALRKFQDILSNMRNEDQKCPSSVLGSQVLPEPVSRAEHRNLENTFQPTKQDSPDKTTDRDATEQAAMVNTCVQFSALQSPKSPSSNVAAVDCLQTNKDENMITSESSIPEAES
ncbi:hypothetical protein ACMD2_01072, partial [Ananas comosus]